MYFQSKKTPLPYVYAISLLILTLMMLGAGWYIWQLTKNDFKKDLTYTSEVVKRYYELSFNQWQLSLLTVGQRLIEIENREKQFEFAKRSSQYYEQLLAFGLADTTGQVLVFSEMNPADSLPNLSKSEKSRRSFSKAKNYTRIQIGEIYYYDDLHKWIIPIRFPISNDQGEIVAINTSGISYESFVSELGSFGFNPAYKVSLINNMYNTIQLHYPLDTSAYAQVLGKDIAIFSDVDLAVLENERVYFDAQNNYENYEIFGVGTLLTNLDHSLLVSVDKQVIFDQFKTNIMPPIYTYLGLILFSTIVFWSVNKLEKNFYNDIERERANLKSIFESTQSIIGLFDQNKRLQEFNGAFYDYAWKIEGLKIKRGDDLITVMKNKKIAALFSNYQDRALNGEKFQEAIDYPTQNGVDYLLFSYNPIYNNEEVVGISMFVENITELRESQKALEKYNKNLQELVDERTHQLEHQNKVLEDALKNLYNTQQQLLQSEKMASLGLLSAGIGHELNNPLNFIKNGSLALSKEIDKSSEDLKAATKPFLAIVDEGVERASKIIKSLGHFSRKGVDMGENCDIHAILENCLTILNNKLKNRVKVLKNYADKPIVVKGNEGKLHQALLNIITNAEQAIENTGMIQITTSISSEEVQISIKDSGVGIPKMNISKISDPFFTTKAPGKGTGLGLFITYDIIEEHKGKISANTDNQQGAEFIITFPNTTVV